MGAVPRAVRRDRVVGVVLASAAGDAPGAPHEFGPALPADRPLAMTGGGPFGWAPGEWTDDTQQAAAVVHALATGPADGALDRIEAALVAWYASGPADVGNQTRAVLRRAVRDGGGLGAAASALQAALAVIAHTPLPAQGPPSGHLRLAVERAVRLGDDTDTVAAIAGALLGAHWSASAVPVEWRDPLHGRLRYDLPPWRAADLERAALVVAGSGREEPPR